MPKPKNGGSCNSPDKLNPKQQNIPHFSRKMSKKSLQEMVRPYAAEAILVLANLMRHGDNDNTRLGAARTLLTKVLPDLKASELTSEDGKELILKIVQYGTQHTV